MKALESRANSLLSETEVELKSRIASLEDSIRNQQAASDVLFKAGGHFTDPADAQKLERQVKKRVLWVDDNPQNNDEFAALLNSLGVKVDRELSTELAINRLSSEKYDLVISDMGRPEGRDAGVQLLRAMRAKGDQTPFIVFSSRNAVARTRAKIIELGGLDAVTGPTALMGRIKPLLFPEGT